MKTTLIALLSTIFSLQAIAQYVGIGTNSPMAKLHVADNSVLFSAPGAVSEIGAFPPVSGQGRRVMWFVERAAFRTGYVGSTQWDRDSIGTYSFAGGADAKAVGSGAIAYGLYLSANGHGSVAFGRYNTAFAPDAMVMGNTNLAYGDASFAGGKKDTTTGDYSFSFGNNNIASGTSSVALGSYNKSAGSGSFVTGGYSEASGGQSFATGWQARATMFASQAIGYKVIASGEYSLAMGSSVSTNGFQGAFVIGDHSTSDVLWSFGQNTFSARFAGGFRLYTNSSMNLGVHLGANQNAWSTVSSVYLKENFKPVDGESFLQKISAMTLTSWNYKGQDKNTLRHYGPMAQDFYAAFGNDGIGTIGEETSINQADFDGVNLVAIQALEKRTASQAETIIALQQQVEFLTRKLEQLLHQTEKL